MILPLLSLAASLSWAAPAPSITVTADPAKAPVVLTAADLAPLKRMTVSAQEHGKKGSFEGWALGDVLERAGWKRGDDLRGPALARYVLASAPDGYRVVFTVTELDPAFGDKVVLLADRRDGAPLGPSEGPFRVVVPGEKRPARWIRGVSSFQVLDAAPRYRNLEVRLVSVSGGTPFAQWDGSGSENLDPDVLFSGDDFRSIDASRGGDDGKTPSLALHFTTDAARRFEDVTAKDTGRRLAVVIGGKVVAAPKILHPITTGLFEITGPAQADVDRMERVIARGE